MVQKLTTFLNGKIYIIFDHNALLSILYLIFWYFYNYFWCFDLNLSVSHDFLRWKLILVCLVRLPTSLTYFAYLLRLPTSLTYFAYLLRLPTSLTYFAYLLRLPTSLTYFAYLLRLPTSLTYFAYLLRLPTSLTYFAYLLRIKNEYIWEYSEYLVCGFSSTAYLIRIQKVNMI